MIGTQRYYDTALILYNSDLQILFVLCCQVYGVVGNPVSHSRSPALHNAALQAAGLDAVYLPYLVDDLSSFLEAFSDADFRGFSVTIPHKVRKPSYIRQTSNRAPSDFRGFNVAIAHKVKRKQ
jgi:hypothetical protein